MKISTGIIVSISQMDASNGLWEIDVTDLGLTSSLPMHKFSKSYH